MYNENPYDINAKKITFAEVFDKWSNEHFKKISASNINGYQSSYKCSSKLYDIHFADIKLAHLQHVVTCISLLTMAGVDDRIIKKIVGHSGKTVTEMVYTHFEIAPLLEAINRI